MAQRPNTTGAVGTALDSSAIELAYIIRLDIDSDPFLAWTGFGDLAFAPGQTGDAALDGQTFGGITHLVAEVGAVQDAQGGSGALEVVVPGVDLMDELMRQIIYDARKWQFRRAWVWLALFDNSGVLIGNPIRLRSGRMDQMPVSEGDDGTGTVKCVIESQQAYATGAIATRYSETKELDPTDNSQDWVWQLANMTPVTGQATVPSPPGGQGGGYGGGGGGRNSNVRLL